MIDPEWYEKEQRELDREAARQQAQGSNTQQALEAIQIEKEQTNLVKEQLGLGYELDVIRHLLKGETLERDKDGNELWVQPEDPNQIILTSHGVHLIMNTILFYLNKNTLLSNYDEKIINEKMEDFAITLSDVIFMEYEKVFKYPTFEECKLVLEERLKRKTELRKYAYELIGKKVDEEEIKERFIEEMEEKIEIEIGKIREQIIKNKLKRFEIIIREVQDAVHSTYLRAWNGQERRTLRQHIHISETSGNNLPQNMIRPQPRKFGVFRR